MIKLRKLLNTPEWRTLSYTPRMINIKKTDISNIKLKTLSNFRNKYSQYTNIDEQYF